METPSERFYRSLGKISLLDTRNLYISHATEVSPSVCSVLRLMEEHWGFSPGHPLPQFGTKHQVFPIS